VVGFDFKNLVTANCGLSNVRRTLWLIADIEQIEQFYDRNLPLSKETARSLQAFWAGGRMIYSQVNGEDKGCGSDNTFCNTCGGHALVVWVHSG